MFACMYLNQGGVLSEPGIYFNITTLKQPWHQRTWSKIGTSVSLSPQAALAQRLTLCHTLAPAHTSFISYIKTPLQIILSGWQKRFLRGNNTPNISSSPLSLHVVVFIYTGCIFYSRLEKLRLCNRRRSQYCFVVLRYATLYVLWLFTLCWWIFALITAVHHD